jgi:hypothetical protein
MATRHTGCSKHRSFKIGSMEKVLFFGAREKVSYSALHISIKQQLIETVGSGKTIVA